MEYIEAKRLNAMLDFALFKGGFINEDEVRRKVGIGIAEMLRAYIFSSKNDFASACKRLKKGQKMSLASIWKNTK